MISKKKDKVLGEYAKIIQNLKREYQTVYTEKSKLKDFLRKQHAKQMDIYSRMIAAHKKKDQTLKEGGIMRVIVVDAESIKDNHRGYKKQKKRSAKKINIDDYDDDSDVDNDDMIRAKLKRNQKKEQRRKVS